MSNLFDDFDLDIQKSSEKTSPHALSALPSVTVCTCSCTCFSCLSQHNDCNTNAQTCASCNPPCLMR